MSTACEQRRLRLASRRDDEHRLGLLDNRHDQALRVEHEAVAGPQDGATRQGGAELDAAIGSSSSVHVRALFPSEGDRVAPEPAARIGQIALADDAFDDGHFLIRVGPHPHALTPSRRGARAYLEQSVSDCGASPTR